MPLRMIATVYPVLPHPRIPDAPVRVGDLIRSHGLAVKVGGADPSDDRVPVAVVSHVKQCRDQQFPAYSFSAERTDDPHGTEESARRGIVAGESDGLFVPDGKEAGHRLVTHCHIDFARPCAEKPAADPSDQMMFFRADRLADDQIIDLGRGMDQIFVQLVKFYQHVGHGRPSFEQRYTSQKLHQ